MGTMTVIKHFDIIDHVTSGLVPVTNDVSNPLGFKEVKRQSLKRPIILQAYHKDLRDSGNST